jgi:uncharacterized DUF497 family protein
LNVAQAIITSIDKLTTFPDLGRPGEIKGARELVCPPYVVDYRDAGCAREVHHEGREIATGYELWPLETSFPLRRSGERGRTKWLEPTNEFVVTLKLVSRFEWDPRKAASNWRKHGVSFETATRVFWDPNALFEQDRIKDNEIRWQAIGIVDGAVLLMVAHAVRDDSDSEVIRIISARHADRKESKRYEEANG